LNVKIAVGSDHAGFQLKESVREILARKGVEVVDYGAFDETSVDYPDVARPLAEDVVAGKADVGVLICSNGVGMSITANKVRGVRAALCHDTFDAMRAREHNNANIVCMGGWCIGKGVAEQILDAYLGATFAGGRHERRVGKIMAIEAEREAAGR
jgi:ribose 5-phosphate isomerase B